LEFTAAAFGRPLFFMRCFSSPANAKIDMESEFERRWRLARTHEIQGQTSDAKAIYEALLIEDPRRLYVALRLSAIEQSMGRYNASRAYALRCAEIVRDSRWSDLAVVTHRLLAFDEQQLVRDLILGVDWTSAEIIRNSAVLSQHLWLTNNVQEALRLIEVAEVRLRPSPQLSYSKANVLRSLGRLDRAAEEYERCIELAPGFADAHWSLAAHRKANPSGSRIDRVLEAQQAYGPDAPEQPFFFYALFKEYEGAGDFSRAWSSLQTGARIKRRSLQFDPVAEAEGFAALESVISPAFVGEAVSLPKSGCAPIFIVGMPRTGTTLMERILGGHSMVTPGGELNDFNAALSIATDHFPQPFITPEAVGRIVESDFPQIGRTYRTRTAFRSQGKQFLTDKNPANFVYAGFMAKALPEARIICMRRDPMDACVSNYKELFASNAYGYSYDLDELADYYRRFDRLCRHWSRAFPDRFLEVKYEELVQDTTNVVARVLNFAGLPFEGGCMDITRNDAPVSTASSTQVREPINAHSVGSWRRYAGFLERLQERFAAGLGA
jgi:tetratricopeptide (TPR) repeat protein